MMTLFDIKTMKVSITNLMLQKLIKQNHKRNFNVPNGVSKYAYTQTPLRNSKSGLVIKHLKFDCPLAIDVVCSADT